MHYLLILLVMLWLVVLRLMVPRLVKFRPVMLWLVILWLVMLRLGMLWLAMLLITAKTKECSFIEGALRGSSLLLTLGVEARVGRGSGSQEVWLGGDEDIISLKWTVF